MVLRPRPRAGKERLHYVRLQHHLWKKLRKHVITLLNVKTNFYWKANDCVTTGCSSSNWHWAHVLVQFHDEQYAACQRMSEPETHRWYGREFPAFWGIGEVCRNDRNRYIISIQHLKRFTSIVLCKLISFKLLFCSSEKSQSDVFGYCSQSRTHSRKF